MDCFVDNHLFNPKYVKKSTPCTSILRFTDIFSEISIKCSFQAQITSISFTFQNDSPHIKQELPPKICLQV